MNPVVLGYNRLAHPTATYPVHRTGFRVTFMMCQRPWKRLRAVRFVSHPGPALEQVVGDWLWVVANRRAPVTCLERGDRVGPMRSGRCEGAAFGLTYEAESGITADHERPESVWSNIRVRDVLAWMLGYVPHSGVIRCVAMIAGQKARVLHTNDETYDDVSPLGARSRWCFMNVVVTERPFLHHEHAAIRSHSTGATPTRWPRQRLCGFVFGFLMMAPDLTLPSRPNLTKTFAYIVSPRPRQRSRQSPRRARLRRDDEHALASKTATPSGHEGGLVPGAGFRIARPLP